MFGGFEGSELSSVYGANDFNSQSPAPPAPPAMQSMNDAPPPRAPTPPEVVYNPPPAMFAQGPSAPQPAVATYTPSYWDTLASKRTEVFKLIAFSLVFLLGLSLHHIADNYLKNYITNAFLTPIQEFLVRLSYPIVVILVLWIIKAST